MKRLGWKLILLIILAAIVFIWLVKAPIVASYLTDKMRVPVSIEWLSIWPSKTKMRWFKIKNPSGFKTPHAFKAESSEVDYSFSQIMGTPSQIDQILIDGIYLSVEFSNPLGTSNNWTAIGNNMPKQQSHKRVLIGKLILTNLTIEIRGLGLLGKPATKTIDRLEFDNIDSANGFPTEELIKKVFGGSGIQQYIQDAFNPQKQLQNLLKPLDIFSRRNEE